MILYIFYKYMHCFFDEAKINRLKECLICLFMALWLIFVDSLAIPHLSSVITLLVIFVLTWIYPAPIGRKLAVTAVVYGIYVLCDVLTARMLTFLGTDRDIFDVVQKISVLTLMYLCELVTEIWIEHMKRIRLKLVESENVKRQIAGYSNQLDVLKNSEEKVRGLRHDLKHHLNELMMMAERDEASEIKEYLKSMDSFMTCTREYVSSGNTDIDSLLNLMLDDAKRELGNVSCKVCIPDGIDIAAFDLNVILGNLLDNAIRAAKQTREKYLYVRISYKTGMLLIQVENSYTGNLIKAGTHYCSTKENAAAHGMGLTNVRRIVDKYNGDMEIKDVNNLFRVSVFLYIKQRISP